MIISIINLKGGAGKTTIATNLLYALSRKEKVMLIDTDMQRSSLRWFNTREKQDENFAVVSITEDKALKKQIPLFSAQYDHIIIDGAPQTDLINAISIYISDLIIVPVTPSPYDIWATETVVERIRQAQELNPNKKACFVLNRANDAAALSRETAEVLNTFELPVLKARLHNRIIYADSALSGTTVLESSNRKAKEEFTALVKEIRSFMTKKANKGKP